MAVTNKRIKVEKKKPSLVITERRSKKNGREVSWSESSDEEDHLYELIRGVPSVMVADRSSQSKHDFVPKRNVINSIGQNFHKTDEKVFWEKKYLFKDEEKGSLLSRGSESEFEVSFDGSFTRGFEGTEFIVSIPIINGMEGKQGCSFLPKRREEVSSDSSSSEGEDEASKEEESPSNYEAPKPPS
jgi:hypothetical protein